MKIEVRSSDPNKPHVFYVVEAHEQGTWWSCTCPHWQFRLRSRRGRCKHIDAVIAHNREQERLQEEIAREFKNGSGIDWADDSPPKPDLFEDEEKNCVSVVSA